MKQSLSVLAEKVLLTYLEAFTAILLAGNVFTDVSVATAAGIAALPAAFTVLANGVQQLEFVTGSPVLDMVGRVIRTYFVSFLGFLVAAPVFSLDVSALQAAAVAAAPAAITVVKSWVASRLGNTETAALLPASLDGQRNV